ncbi:unnamed protein product [Chironomus riparius]|uniref:Uncharacterized protein n=1 Tax=Chironomus riparius TaxID=315576 RepID=A0A9N9S540_9DIPT|nr:unnamed protein product [Chironomus riparius]
MLDGTDLFWIILGVTVSLIIFFCCCIGCIIVCIALCEDDNDDKTEETTQKSSKTVDFSSSEVGWAVPGQSGGIYPPASSIPPYPPMSAPSPPPYPTLNQTQAPYPAANSRTPSPMPYLPYPVENVNEKRKVTEDIDGIRVFGTS